MFMAFDNIEEKVKKLADFIIRARKIGRVLDIPKFRKKCVSLKMK